MIMIMSETQSVFEMPKKFWSQIKDLDGQLHERAPIQSGGWRNRQAACAWNRPYDGPKKQFEELRILTLWKSRKRFGGLAELTGMMRIFTPKGALTEAGTIPVHEKRILYDATFPASFIGSVMVYHHDYTTIRPEDVGSGQGRRPAIGTEVIRKNPMQPTFVDYEQLLEEMRIGASGEHMLPLEHMPSDF